MTTKAKSHPPEPLLEGARIRRLRLQAGYSHRRLARMLGVSASTIRGLEEGTNHDQLPLTLIDQLAQHLAVSIPELFGRPDSEAVMPACDDRIIEAALRCATGLIAIADLADAMDWTLERTRSALDALDERVQPTGTRMHRNSWQQCALRPATEHLTDHQQHALHQIGPRSRGLTHLTAQLLVAATRGEIDDHWFKTATNGQRVALQSLLKQGVLLTAPGDSKIVPAPDAVYGLQPRLTFIPDPGDVLAIPRPPGDHPTAAQLHDSDEGAESRAAFAS